MPCRLCLAATTKSWPEASVKCLLKTHPRKLIFLTFLSLKKSKRVALFGEIHCFYRNDSLTNMENLSEFLFLKLIIQCEKGNEIATILAYSDCLLWLSLKFVKITLKKFTIGIDFSCKHFLADVSSCL